MVILTLISPYRSLPPELGVLRPVRRPHHRAGVHGGEECLECIRGQDPAAAQGQLPPERGAEAHAEQGVCDPACSMSPSMSTLSSSHPDRASAACGKRASRVLIRCAYLICVCWAARSGLPLSIFRWGGRKCVLPQRLVLQVCLFRFSVFAVHTERRFRSRWARNKSVVFCCVSFFLFLSDLSNSKPIDLKKKQTNNKKPLVHGGNCLKALSKKQDNTALSLPRLTFMFWSLMSPERLISSGHLCSFYSNTGLRFILNY